jgi:ATP-binding cassette subfamily B protein/subfamily B ATP-binding cassette protein MsbA
MAFYDAVVKPVTELTGIVTLVLAIVVGAYLVLYQETHLFGIRLCSRPLSASSLFTFYAMLAGAADPARRMSDIYTVLFRSMMTSQSMFTMFAERPRITAPERRTPVPRHQRQITFEGVCFGYKPDQRVLQDVTLEIPFGQTVAVVGENGCGKTTLMNLLARFYDPQSGAIFIDGVNLHEVAPKQLRRQLALVTQEPILFRGSIRDNIRYGNSRATVEELLAAAKLAQVDGFVQRLPAGYDTDVGDGGSCLSGGQRQRVALARALLADPRILILDEATSQIDRGGEQLLHESLKPFLGQRTTIIITHRLSTLDLADRVIVMESGRIVDDMTPLQYRQGHGPLQDKVKRAA